MKTIHFFALLSGLILTSACSDNLSMNTEIRADGSCRREIWFKPKSSGVLTDSTFSRDGVIGDVLDNGTWQKRCKFNGTREELPYPLSQAQYDSVAALCAANGKAPTDTLSIHAWREFPSVGEMAGNWPVFIGCERLKADAKLEKQFRWFYTDYTFSETFECLMPKFSIPLTNFLTQDDINFWLTGKPDLLDGMPGCEMSGYLTTYEKLFNRWVNANLCNDVALVIAKYYDSIPNPPMPRDAFVATWDSLAHNLENFPDTWCDDPTALVFRDKFHTDFYEKLAEDEFWKKKFDEEGKNDFYADLLAFECDYSVFSMPGKIEETPHWDLDPDVKYWPTYYNHTRSGFHYRLKGYNLLATNNTLVVCSREKNLWAFAVTMLFALAVLFFAGRYLWRYGR